MHRRYSRYRENDENSEREKKIVIYNSSSWWSFLLNDDRSDSHQKYQSKSIYPNFLKFWKVMSAVWMFRRLDIHIFHVCMHVVSIMGEAVYHHQKLKRFKIRICIQLNEINMAVLFWYFVKHDASYATAQ